MTHIWHELVPTYTFCIMAPVRHRTTTPSLPTPPTTTTTASPATPVYRKTPRWLNVLVLTVPLLLKNAYTYYQWNYGPNAMSSSAPPTLPATQTTWQVTQVGKPLQPNTIPVTPPGDGQITIEVHASSVNPLDWKLQHANFLNFPIPYSIGFDIAGTVAALGTNVSDYSIGDKVFTRQPGGYGQYVTTAVKTAAKFKHLSYIEAAAIPIAFLSAYDPLYLVTDISKRKGQTIYIAGGAGGVGHYACQLALYEGLNVISSGSKPESLALLKKLGVQHIIDYSKQDVVAEVMKLTDNKGADVVYDPTYSPSSFKQSASVVAKGGIWMKLGQLDQAAEKSIIDIVQQRGAEASYGDLGRYARDPVYQAKSAQIIAGYGVADKLFGEGKMKPHVNKVYPLDQVNTALDNVRTGKDNVGKVVVSIK